VSRPRPIPLNGVSANALILVDAESNCAFAGTASDGRPTARSTRLPALRFCWTTRSTWPWSVSADSHGELDPNAPARHAIAPGGLGAMNEARRNRTSTSQPLATCQRTSWLSPRLVTAPSTV